MKASSAPAGRGKAPRARRLSWKLRISSTAPPAASLLDPPSSADEGAPELWRRRTRSRRFATRGRRAAARGSRSAPSPRARSSTCASSRAAHVRARPRRRRSPSTTTLAAAAALRPQARGRPARTVQLRRLRRRARDRRPRRRRAGAAAAAGRQAARRRRRRRHGRRDGRGRRRRRRRRRGGARAVQRGARARAAAAPAAASSAAPSTLPGGGGLPVTCTWRPRRSPAPRSRRARRKVARDAAPAQCRRWCGRLEEVPEGSSRRSARCATRGRGSARCGQLPRGAAPSSATNGAGETAQSVTLLSASALHGVSGPFLIVVPLSTLPRWQRQWTAPLGHLPRQQGGARQSRSTSGRAPAALSTRGAPSTATLDAEV